MKKKGVSELISTVILVGLVIATVAVVGVVVRNLVLTSTEKTSSCFGSFDKIKLDSLYTCYNSSYNTLRFSLSIEDVEVDKVIVAISGQGTTKSFEILSSSSEVSGLTSYPAGLSAVQLPGKNSGLTYAYDLTIAGFSGSPDRIEIAPIINGKQCESSGYLTGIEDC